MSQEQKCCQCFSRFNVSRLPHILGCSHNICELCLKQLENHTQTIVICEFCQTSFPSHKLADLPYNQTLKLDIPDQEQLTQISIKQRVMRQDLVEGVPEVEAAQTMQLCGIHKVPMDIICINDKVRVCPHCALFGAHKNHAVRRVEDFKKEVAQKCQIFRQIQTQKPSSKVMKTHGQLPYLIKNRIDSKKAQLTKEINLYIDAYIQILKQLRESLQNEANNYLKDFQTYLKKNKAFLRYQRSKTKFEKWEKDCDQIVKKVEKQVSIDNTIDLYFNSPLELVSEGYIYTQELNKFGEEIQAKISQKIDQFRLLIDTEMPQLLQKCLRFKKTVLTPPSSGVKQINQDVAQANPFLDCTSSQIDIQNYIFNQNTSMEVEFSTLTNSWKGAQNLAVGNLQKKMSSPEKGLHSLKDIERKEISSPIVGRYSMKSPKSASMKGSQMRLTKATQPTKGFHPKTAQKNQHALKQMLPPQTMPKPYDCKQPEKLYAEFMRNTLTDFFDLSDCNLPNQKILQYVHRAKKSHKIKGLKLCSNQLTTEGFEKLADCLKGVCNINLANNKIDETIFEVVAKNRERIESLRILNLSHNPINFQKKSRMKLQEIKKMGVIVIL